MLVSLVALVAAEVAAEVEVEVEVEVVVNIPVGLVPLPLFGCQGNIHTK